MSPGAYTYDAFSRLTCARSAATTCGSTAAVGRVTYTLDVFSRAWQRNENGSIVTYSYRGLAETLAKSVLGTTATKYALTSGGSPLGQKVGTAAASYYLRDPHGDAVGVVSTAGANQGTTAFDPYGKVLGTSGTQPVFGYQSDLTDPLTKQVDMGTRWYAPQTGRFSSQDVLFGDPLHPISLNQWVYGADSPVTRWDPTGMLDAIAEGGSSNKLSDCAYGPHPGCRGYDGGVVNGAHVTTYVPPPPPPEPSEPQPFEVVNPRAAAMQRAYADAAARASDDDPGCGFFGYHCIARVGGAVGRGVVTGVRTLGEFAWEHKSLIALGLCLAAGPASFACGAAALGLFAGNEVDLYRETGGDVLSWDFAKGTGINMLRSGALLLPGKAVSLAKAESAATIAAAEAGEIPSVYAQAVTYSPAAWRAIDTVAGLPGIVDDGYCGVVGSSHC